MVIGRDVLILLVAAVALALGKLRADFPPSVWGKLSTGIQIAFVVALMAYASWPAAQVSGGDPQMGHRRDDASGAGLTTVGWHGAATSIMK